MRVVGYDKDYKPIYAVCKPPISWGVYRARTGSGRNELYFSWFKVCKWVYLKDHWGYSDRVGEYYRHNKGGVAKKVTW